MSKDFLPRKKEIYYQILHFSAFALGYIRLRDSIFIYQYFLSFSVILSYLNSNLEQTSITLCPSRNLPLHYVLASCADFLSIHPELDHLCVRYVVSATFKYQNSLILSYFPSIHIQNVTEFTKCIQANNIYLLPLKKSLSILQNLDPFHNSSTHRE
jgi:hypothetical protein